jgi:hypothetical protein
MDAQRRLPFFQRHSRESRAAAISMLEGSKTIRARVFRFIRSRGGRGATAEEITVQLGLRLSRKARTPSCPSAETRARAIRLAVSSIRP